MKESEPASRGILSYAARLRFPYLFALTATLFLIDLAVPDMIPFADEILLGLGTLLLGTLKKKRQGQMQYDTKR